MTVDDVWFLPIRTLLEREHWSFRNSADSAPHFHCLWNGQEFDGFVAHVNDEDQAIRAFLVCLRSYFQNFSDYPYHLLIVAQDEGGVEVLNILKRFILPPNWLTVVFYNGVDGIWEILKDWDDE